MLKIIKLKLLKIKYSGDSIGDDIRVEIETAGHILTIDKKIKVGATVEINREVDKFDTNQKLFKTDIKITVIEKDMLFNDVGNMDGIIKVDTVAADLQEFVFKVQVKETRSILLDKFWGKGIAIFELFFAAEVIDAIRRVPDVDDGWLKVILEKNKLPIGLPAFLKIRTNYIKNKREYFTILEGIYRGELASVKLQNNDSARFIFGIEDKPMAKAIYSISKKIFTLNGKEYKAVDHPKTPWQKGLYDIEIPDSSHRGGERYKKESIRAKTWFRIGHDGERYLHAGSRSLGCMTIVEVKHWTEIYDSIIKARKGDFLSVGVVDVVD